MENKEYNKLRDENKKMALKNAEKYLKYPLEAVDFGFDSGWKAAFDYFGSNDKPFSKFCLNCNDESLHLAINSPSLRESERAIK